MQLVARVCEFYVSHLSGVVPVVLVTDNAEFAQKYSGAHVFVLSMREYLLRFWPHLTEVTARFDSLWTALQSIKSGSEGADDAGATGSVAASTRGHHSRRRHIRQAPRHTLCQAQDA